MASPSCLFHMDLMVFFLLWAFPESLLSRWSGVALVSSSRDAPIFTFFHMPTSGIDVFLFLHISLLELLVDSSSLKYRIKSAVGDARVGTPAEKLWSGTRLRVTEALLNAYAPLMSVGMQMPVCGWK